VAQGFTVGTPDTAGRLVAPARTPWRSADARGDGAVDVRESATTMTNADDEVVRR
jgi:hypothetical protein